LTTYLGPIMPVITTFPASKGLTLKPTVTFQMMFLIYQSSDLSVTGSAAAPSGAGPVSSGLSDSGKAEIGFGVAFGILLLSVMVGAILFFWFKRRRSQVQSQTQGVIETKSELEARNPAGNDELENRATGGMTEIQSNPERSDQHSPISAQLPPEIDPHRVYHELETSGFAGASGV
jgi:hypothetical protein